VARPLDPPLYKTAFMFMFVFSKPTLSAVAHAVYAISVAAALEIPGGGVV